MRRKTADQLRRIELLLEGVADACEQIADALNPATAGGLAVATAEAKQARAAAESAFVGVQALASQATAKPGVPELARAVSAQTDALRAQTGALRVMEETVRTATGPQPALTGPAPVKPAAAEGMGSRVPKTRGGKP